MTKLSLSALAAAGILAGMTGANAADLGGNCCADLEERIAELEATTARKGNRKVSLTISGWVAQEVVAWDDGARSKVYVQDIGATLASNVKFTGQAKISPDWSAGYVLHLEARGSDALASSQHGTTVPAGGNNASVGGQDIGAGVVVLQSFWFVKSETLGKLSVGTQSSAADNVALLPDGSGTLVFANYIQYENNGFFLRKNGRLFDGSAGTSALTWGSFATCPGLQTGVSADCDGVPNNNVRYDTPVFGGFSASVSWGEADIWAVAGRYAGEISEFKVAAAAAYTESTNITTPTTNPAAANFAGGTGFNRVNGGALQIGAYVQHIPTGLFVYGAYGKDYNYNVSSWAGKPDGDNYYIKAGIRQKWSPLGATVLFGEYGKNEDKQSIAQFESGVTSSNLTQWGVGLVQEVDAAAMSMFFVYRNYSADSTCAAVNVNTCGAAQGLGTTNFDNAQLFKAGALISF